MPTDASTITGTECSDVIPGANTLSCNAPRWQFPTLLEVSAAESTERTPCAEALLAQRVAELEAELRSLHADVGVQRETAAAEGRAQGYDEGRSAGLAAALQEAQAQRAAVAAAFGALEAKFLLRLTDLDSNIENAVHDLLVALCSSVLRVELASNDAALRRLIDDAFGSLRGELSSAVVALHPDDLALLGETALATRADDTLGRGELCLRTPLGDVEASLPARVRSAIAQLERGSS